MQSIDLHEAGNHRVVVVGPERAVRIPYRFRPSPEGAWVTLQPAPHVHAKEIEEARSCLLRGHSIAGIRVEKQKGQNGSTSISHKSNAQERPGSL